MMRRAAVHSAALSLLFLLVYGGCNWLSAQRTDAGTLYFAWERHIPFLPWMIIPYLSIDAFFIAAPFLFRDRNELSLHARRIAAAIVIAGACFLLVPLRFAFDRPHAGGWAGALIQWFASVDRPFNLFPSLHVTLAVILADAFRNHSKGVLRAALTAWFGLVVASTVFVYQHHAADVAGGAALAAVVLYGIRARSSRTATVRYVRIAGLYVLGALLLAIAAATGWPWTGVLLWPAVALAVVSAGYFGAGAAVYAKTNGAVTRSAWCLLWPAIAGHWLSHAYYRRQCRPWDELAPGVWIGRRLTGREATRAIREGVTAVLDLAAELDEVAAFRTLRYKSLPVLDLTAPAPEQIAEGVRFIRAQSRRGIVYVHCKIGYSRTAVFAAAYLLAAGSARSADEAIARLRRVRPSIVIRPEAELAIRRFESTLARRRSFDHGQPVPRATFSVLAGFAARVLCGKPRWAGCAPDARQRIYFANHTSHLDFPLLWGSLPAEVRLQTRPVAGRDYWNRGRLRRYLARRVFRMLLVDRSQSRTDCDRVAAIARRSVTRAARALDLGATLIIFPEGTRGNGVEVGPFKSGLYHLCRLRPDVELVPVFLENIHRMLPKGEAIPVPIAGSVTFGRPLRVLPGEDKEAFLARARTALVTAGQPCIDLPTPILRAS